MMSNSSYLFASIIVLITYSCKDKRSFTDAEIENQVEVINIPENPDEMPDLREYIKKVSIIPLETTDQGLISQVTQLIYKNDKIFIYDVKLRELFIFDKSGQFLSRLDKKGKGPGEYTDLRDVEVDDQGNIYALTTRAIQVYKEDGTFIKQINFKPPNEYHINPTQFAFSGKKGFFLWSGATGMTAENSEGSFCIYEIDKNGEFLDSGYIPLKNRIKGGSRFSRVGNNVYLYTVLPITGLYDIYHASENKFALRYKLNYGDRELPRKYLETFKNGEILHNVRKEHEYVTDIVRLSESNDYLYYADWCGQNTYLNLYSKKSKESLRVPLTNSISFFPNIVGTTGNNEFIGFYDAFMMKDICENSREFEKHFGSEIPPSICEEVSASNNPYLVFLELDF